jgi:hypothetical protein
MSDHKSAFDRIFDAVLDQIEKSLVKPPPSPRPQRPENVKSAEEIRRARQEQTRDRMLTAARQSEQKALDRNDAAVHALNDSLSTLYERWPGVPGMPTHLGGKFKAFGVGELDAAIGYVRYLLTLIGPEGKIGSPEPGDKHIFDKDGSREIAHLTARLSDAEDQQRPDEQTIVKQARRIEELEQGRSDDLAEIHRLRGRNAEFRFEPGTGKEYRLMGVSKSKSAYVATIADDKGEQSEVPLVLWTTWRKS